jgi:hypothetical protein
VAQPTARRWIAVLRDLLPDRPEFVEAVKVDDGPAIVALLERYMAEAEQELRDFRRSHREYEAKLGRLGRLESHVWNDDDHLDWEEWDALRARLDDARKDPDVDWYVTEIGQRTDTIRSWRYRIRGAKNVAGIEPLPVHSR